MCLKYHRTFIDEERFGGLTCFQNRSGLTFRNLAVEMGPTVDGQHPFRTTLKPWETIVCWYLAGNHHSRVFLKWCRMSSIHSVKFHDWRKGPSFAFCEFGDPQKCMIPIISCIYEVHQSLIKSTPILQTDTSLHGLVVHFTPAFSIRATRS